MEEASITQIEESKQEPQDQSMYQQGRFPSIVDTDDLVFELGKQVVDRINKEKSLESIFKKTKALEVNMLEMKKLQAKTEKKAMELKSSNLAYEENNKKLDKELVNVRNELENQKNKTVKIKTEFEDKSAESTRFSNALVEMRAELKGKNVEIVKVKQISSDLEKKLELERMQHKENEKCLKEEVVNLKDVLNKLKKKPRISKKN